MTFRQYLMIMTIATVLAICAWLFIVFRVDPVSTGFFGHLLFFLTLGVALVGLFSTLGVAVRVLVTRKEGIVHREVRQALRHSLFFTALILSNLLLASLDYLRWWTMLLLILAFGLLELFFWTSRRESVVQSPSN